MNRLTVVRGVLATVTLAAAGSIVVNALAGSTRGAGAADNAAVGPAPDEPRPPRARADSLVQIVGTRDPFRASRSAASTRFDPRGADGGAPPPQAPPRPAPVVAGVMTGSDPSVVLEGIPGIQGARVLRVGESAGGYLVRSIAEDLVVVVGPDTTWTLHLRKTFP